MPRGAHLSPASFASRHRLNTVLLWLHPPLMVLVGLSSNRSAAAIVVCALPQVLFALMAMAAHGQTARATLTSAGLVSATIAIIELSNGVTEGHFHSLVVMLFVGLYQQWQALIATTVIGVSHHIGLGILLPEHVFAAHHGIGGADLAALLGVHVAAFAAEILGILVLWHFAEKAEAETVAAQETVRRERQRFRTLVQKSSDVVLVTDEAGTITWASPAARHVMGFQPSDLAHTPWTSLAHPSERDRAIKIVTDSVATPDGEVRVELRVRHANGDWRWHEITIRNLSTDPAVGGLVLNHRDVTERREFQDRLAYEASHDALTGLINRAMFFHVLEQALHRTARHGGTLAVLFVDLDGFKQVNDTLGHDCGDLLLREVADRMLGCVRACDTVARLGGDEFVVLLDGLTDDSIPNPEAGVKTVTSRIIEALERPIQLGDDIGHVSGSIGVAMAHDGDATADSLMRTADAAMYREKRARKSAV